MSFAAAFADRDREIAGRPAARNPASLGEVWRSEWQAAGLDTMTGVGRPWQDAQDDLEGAFKQATGESVFDAATRKGIKLPGSSFEGRAAAVRQLIADLDGSQRQTIEPFLDVRARARTKAAEIERQAEDTSDRTFGLSGTAVGFLAGVARQTVDPVNLVTLPLGAARGAGVLRMLATEAGVGAATQAAQEPVIQSGRAALGLEAGFGQAIGNIAEAGLGAAGMAGLLRGAGYVLRRTMGLDAPADGRVPAGPESARLNVNEMPPSALETALTRPAGEPPALRAEAEPALQVPAARLDDAAMQPALRPAEPTLRADLQPELRNALDELQPDDFEAAARVIERDTLVDLAAPVQADEARLRHREVVDQAGAALETGRVAELAERLDPPAPLQTPLSRGADKPKATRPGKPQSLAQFIARNGGLELTDETRYYAFDKTFVPGGGPLARKSGRSIDGFWRERLIEEGFLPRDADGYSSRDIWAELSQKLQAEQQGRRSYRIADEADVMEAQARADFEAGQVRYEAELEAQAQVIRDAHAGFGPTDIDSRSLYEAAELMVRGDVLDPNDALERVFMRQVLNDELSPAARQDYDLPDYDGEFDALQRGTARQVRGEAGGDGAGRAERGQAQGPAGARADGAASGQGGGSPFESRLLAVDGDDGAAARLADAGRLIDEAGDHEFYIPDGFGDFVKASARDYFERLKQDADAAAELKACLGGAP